jgi:hypothetical protein
MSAASGAVPGLPLVRVVSGGQSGVDRAALDWAIRSALEHGGWCPSGRRAEDGAIDSRYRLRETRSYRYDERTERNVIDSDATLVLNLGPLDGGTARTVAFAQRHARPCLIVALDDVGPEGGSRRVRAWLRDHAIRTLNVAGPRESKRPGIYRLASDLLDRLSGAPPAPC